MKQNIKTFYWDPKYEIPDAVYTPAALPEHAGNPLIEALPDFYQAADMINEFARVRYFTDEERQTLSPPQRMLAVLRLNNWLEPLPAHFEVIDTIGLMVRGGYANRNPTNPADKKSLVERYHKAKNGQICPIGDSGASTANAFALFGVSGTGKTTVVERCLDFLPQIIAHGKHGFEQIVWMKVECPQDGSIKQLLIDILKKCDKMIGTNYRNELKSSPTIDHLIGSVANVLASHHCGLLVIDEIQNILDANGIGQVKMINTLVSYVNEAKLPLVVIGKPRALNILEGTFRAARRIGDFGSIIWDRLPLGEEYYWFLECLSKFQCVKTPVNLLDFKDIFYESTQGIHALNVRLSQLSQIFAIQSGIECITKDIIVKVAKEKFKLMAPMLEALKKGNNKAIVKYEDLFTKGLKEIKKDVGSQAELSVLREQNQKRNQGSFNKLRTISTLLQIGYDEGLIQKIVTDLYDENPDITIDKAVLAILKSLQTDTSGVAGSKSLSEIIQAKASGENSLEALKKAGLVEQSAAESSIN